MKKISLTLIGLLFFINSSKVFAQSEMAKMVEVFVKEILIPSIEVKITDRFIGQEAKGVKPIVIKAKRKGIYSDSYIKETLNKLTKEPGSFGPKSGFSENIEIVGPWKKREDIKEVNSHTYWKVYEKSMLNILLPDNQITFIMFDNFKGVN